MWVKLLRSVSLSINSNYFVCDVYIPLLHWLHDSADCLEVHAFYINQVSNLLNKLMQFQSNCSSVFGKAKANNDLSECYRFFICMHILYLKTIPFTKWVSESLSLKKSSFVFFQLIDWMLHWKKILYNGNGWSNSNQIFLRFVQHWRNSAWTRNIYKLLQMHKTNESGTRFEGNLFLKRISRVLTWTDFL